MPATLGETRQTSIRPSEKEPRVGNRRPRGKEFLDLGDAILFLAHADVVECLLESPSMRP